MADSVYTSIVGLRDLLRDLDAIDKDFGQTVRQAIVRAADPILAQAKRNAPYDPTHRGHRHHLGSAADPGHIRDSLFIEEAPRGANLRTTHPGAPVHHWGGTIAPRGTSITIKRQEFASRAGQQTDISDRVEREIAALLEAHNL